jgi:hypothetical protein
MSLTQTWLAPVSFRFFLIGKYRQIMPRLSGAWKGCWLWLQEQPLPGQALEKAVAADLYASLSQLGLEHLVELAAAGAGLQVAFALHELGYQVVIKSLTLATLPLGIIVLPAHTQPPADRTDTDPHDVLGGFLHGYVGCVPRCFFLKSSVSLIPARSSAILA